MVNIGKITKYDSYKESGEGWVEEIPSHWDIKRLKHIFYEKKHLKNISLNCGAISFGEVVTKSDDRIPKSTKASYQEVLSGEFLINPLNLNYDLISLRIALSKINVVVSAGYIVIKEKINIEKKYFKYLLHRYDVASMKLLGSGVRQTINFNHIANSLLLYPPIQEQNLISQYLYQKTAQIDEAIAIKEQQIALLKERKQIIIQKAVTQGLDPNVPMKDSGVDWIGEIPEHWGLISIKLLVEVRDGTHDTPAYVEPSDRSRYLITSKDFIDLKINFSEAKSISFNDHLEICKRSRVESGDLLMSMIGGNIGKSVIAGSFSDFSIKNVALFKTATNKELSKYIQYYLLSGLLEMQLALKSRGGAQPFLSLTDIRSLVFFKFGDQERIEIVNFLNKEMNIINKSVYLIELQINKLKEYKTTLINSAVTGKIKITPEMIGSSSKIPDEELSL